MQALAFPSQSQTQITRGVVRLLSSPLLSQSLSIGLSSLSEELHCYEVEVLCFFFFFDFFFFESDVWSTFGPWLHMSFCVFHSYKVFGGCPPGQIFLCDSKDERLPTERNEICLQPSKCDSQVHYMCSISADWSQSQGAASPPETLSAI